MKLYFLGTGTSQGVPVIGCKCDVCLSNNPKDHRLRSSVLIQHQAQNILIDIGPDFRQQMLQGQFDDIGSILLTHEHADHIGGFDDIRPINFKWRKNIPIYGKQRTLDSVQSMYHYAFAKNPYPGVPRIDLIPVEEGAFNAQGIEIEALSIMHGKLDIFGYKLDDIVYITDANAIPAETLAKVKNCDTLIINALRQSSHPSHFTLNEALEQIKLIQPKKAYITHVSHLMGLETEISEHLPQNVYLAFDGLSVDIQ